MNCEVKIFVVSIYLLDCFVLEYVVGYGGKIKIRKKEWENNR